MEEVNANVSSYLVMVIGVPLVSSQGQGILYEGYLVKRGFEKCILV